MPRSSPRSLVPAVLPFVLLGLSACDPASDAGRAGNAHLSAGRSEDARAAYGRGLAVVDTARHDLVARLVGNRALAHLARDSARAALDDADLAAARADDIGLRRNALYHGGIAAAASQQSDDALARFRAALRLDGAFDDAAYNWEVVARAQAQSGGDGGGDTPRNADPNQDPSGGGQDDAPNDAPPRPDPQGNPGGRQPGDDPTSPPNDRTDASTPPPRISEAEADRLLDAAGRDEARLMRRTVRGTHSAPRPTRDW